MILKKFIATILYYVFFFCENLLNINIRFLIIQQSRIGHLLTNIDQAISLMKKKQKNFFLFIYLSGHCSNEFLLKLWKKSSHIFYIDFTLKIINASNYNFKLKRFILNWDDIQPNFTKLYVENKNIIIKNEILSKLKNKYEILSKDFVCLHNRDDYYSSIIAKDKNYLDYKNFEFNDFDLVIKKIIYDGLLPIRIGKYINSKTYENKKLIDLTSKFSNSELDILLQYFAKITIIGSTGLAAVTTTFRKPCLYVNYLPLNTEQMSYVSANSMIIPKLIKKKDTNRFIKFKEMDQINFNIHQEKNFINEQNLEVINNSAEDILNGYKEMRNFLKNNEFSKEMNELNKLFFNSFINKEHSDFLLNKTKIRVPVNFLKKYADLI